MVSISVQVQTAVISALVAAFVTLVIEVAAKPRLEARKDRVVAMARLRRELESDLLGLLQKSGYLMMLYHPVGSPIGAAALRDLRNDAASVQSKYRQLLESGPLPRRVAKIVSYVLGAVDFNSQFLQRWLDAFPENWKDHVTTDVRTIYISWTVNQLIWDLSRAYSVVKLRRWRYIKYRRALAHLSKDAKAAGFTVSAESGPNLVAHMRQVERDRLKHPPAGTS